VSSCRAASAFQRAERRAARSNVAQRLPTPSGWAARAESSSDQFFCRVLNAGPTQLTKLAVRILDDNGAVLAEAVNGQPLPGATLAVSYFGLATIGYCKVEGSFSRKRALVTFCAARSGETICEASVGDPGL
jgi:hypothetical protein